MMLGMQVNIGGISIALESEDIEPSVEVVETFARVLSDRAVLIYNELPDVPATVGDDDEGDDT